MDASKIRGKFMAMQAERDAARDAEAALRKKLETAQALESARHKKLTGMLKKVELREEELAEQEARLTRVQDKAEQATAKLDDIEQQWRSLQAEELFRKRRKSRTDVPARKSSATQPGGGLQERLEHAQTAVRDGNKETVDLQSRIATLEERLNQLDEKEEALNERNKHLSYHLSTLADEIAARRRANTANQAKEEKLQERIKQILEKLEQQRKRREAGECEVLRLEGVLDSVSDQGSRWEQNYRSACEALNKAREDLGELMNCF